jgi:hypothetical protein
MGRSGDERFEALSDEDRVCSAQGVFIMMGIGRDASPICAAVCSTVLRRIGDDRLNQLRPTNGRGGRACRFMKHFN